MDNQLSISAEELAGRLISIVMLNEATKRILSFPRDGGEIEQTNRTALYELSFLTLYAIITTCFSHPLLRKNQKDAHRFADLVQEAFLLVMTSNDKSEVRASRIENMNKDFAQRWDKYDSIINKINSNEDNEKFVIEFEKTVTDFLGLNETSEEIKSSLDKYDGAGWYLFLHLRAYDTRKILDKYSSINF